MAYNISTVKHTYDLMAEDLTEDEFMVFFFIESINLFNERVDEIDEFQDNGYTKEEMKMVKETVKIFGDENIKVTATAVRLPIVGGHAESLNVEFCKAVELDAVKDIIAKTPGVKLMDNPEKNEYPMPIHAHNKNEVFVGRVRIDETQPNTVNLWVVADNLRKGAATNTVQIAEYLVSHSLVNG